MARLSARVESPRVGTLHPRNLAPGVILDEQEPPLSSQRSVDTNLHSNSATYAGYVELPMSPQKAATIGKSRSGVEKKKSKRKKSVACKARHRKLAAKAKRASLGDEKEDRDCKLTEDELEDEDEEENSTKATRTSKSAPNPERVHNDELDSVGLEYEVDKLLNSRIDAKGNRDYLVKWVGWSVEDATWEPEVHLRNSLEKISEFDEEFPNAP